MPSLVPETLRVVSGGPFEKPILPVTPLFRPPEHPKAIRLREKYRLMEVAGPGGDFERARRLKTWVRSRWNHGWDNEDQKEAIDILARAERGGTFNCGFYSRTFIECCLAVGLPARQMSILRKNYDFQDYCRHNEGHAVVEVYCRDLAKWVMLDADANAFFTIDGIPASSLEVHRSWHTNRGRDAKMVGDDPPFVVPTSCPVVSDAYLKTMFRELLRHETKDYYYHVSTFPSNGYLRCPRTADHRRLWYAGVCPPPLAATYRGINLDGAVFVEEQPLFDWPLDQTFVKAAMAGQRPCPKIEVRLDHNMPFLDHFELRVGAKPFRRVKSDRKALTLPAGRTRIRARCVDTFGLPGHEAELVVRLKPASPEVLARRKTKYWL